MKTKYIILLSFLLLFLYSPALADRQLEREEILQIFQKLTSQPRKTWIPAGTIKAIHEEYGAPKEIDLNVVDSKIRAKVKQYQGDVNKRELALEMQKMKLDAIPFNTHYELSNEYTMSSSVTVKFDGERFYWEINVKSRKDSVKPGKDLEGNFMTDQFDLNWNARRIFAWDGEKYTTYFLPGNYSIVDTTDMVPYAVDGPLTAGIIPWGYDYYTYDNLSIADSYGFEKYIDGQMQIHLVLINPDDSEVLFVLDPARNYSVLSCSITRYNNVIISRHYSDYQLVAGQWIPSFVLLERYEAETNRLLASNLWNITSIDTNVPESYDFDVPYEDDALIEHFAFNDNVSEIYRYSHGINTDMLLSERLAYTMNEGLQPQNCATAALKYAIGQLGKDVTDQELAPLVSESNQTTSLYQMKQFAQGIGFYCKAVKIDIENLKNIDDCEIILHIPGKGHFVVVSGIDDKFIRIVDLTDRKFYYRADLNFFSMDWTEGTALLISKSPIEGRFTEINEMELAEITGALGYACNVLYQAPSYIPCEGVGEDCGGAVRVYVTRWGCGFAESGSCSMSQMLRYIKAPCIDDGFTCGVVPQDQWIYYYMMACN